MSSYPAIVVVRWRDTPRLLLHGHRVRVGRVWAGWRPYILWSPST